MQHCCHSNSEVVLPVLWKAETSFTIYFRDWSEKSQESPQECENVQFYEVHI